MQYDISTGETPISTICYYRADKKNFKNAKYAEMKKGVFGHNKNLRLTRLTIFIIEMLSWFTVYGMI